MYGICEMLCWELVVKYLGYILLMLVIWFLEEIQVFVDGMDIFLFDFEIRIVLVCLEDILEDQ